MNSPNWLGSVRLVVNASTGAVVQRMDYDAWGNVETDTSPGFQPFGFAGGLRDLATGLLRFGARDYDSSVGRWIAKDPIAFAGQETNLYLYASNSPAVFIDPTGLSRLEFSKGGGYIDIYPGDSPSVQGPPQRFPASNNPSNPNADPYKPGGHGPVPDGEFPTGPVIETGGDLDSAFGSAFIPILLPRHEPYDRERTGAGVHAGRASHRRGVNSGTQGCVRTTEAALEALRADPPTRIKVVP